ncbi:Lysylphosphatidylglycerol biosynthesis bifunctional protein LysX [Austwickia sp. TVS 96-490-7B]|uniref:bifunctional lysylphosphatidylglycerol synthetase/lysine--tRNA ligase LysX n=1 Tax=Austwickia sp. TVS 96-490-7B TaxID=2830843 RepID=UPI001C564BCE|nr:bifunctional lysylphosphatidylglycerol synthetase/lysine--tRNA ligase LysX [Austwickia sp. TVS 96-490-7B]MBW3084084.1 Lysylphosphatidylglycerol biosynthesis bifunctional protein LysX [Austwickia sp. TVS 96-490-7B]
MTVTMPREVPEAPRRLWQRFSGAFPAIFATIVAFNAIVSGALVLMSEDPFASGSDLGVWISVVADIIPSPVWSVILLLVSSALAARKRVAWAVCVGWAGLNTLMDILMLAVDDPQNGIYLSGVVAHTLLLMVLLATYGQFWTRVRGGAYAWAAATLGGGLFGAVMLGWALVELFPGTLPADKRLSWVFQQIFPLLFDFNDYVSAQPAGIVSLIPGFLGSAALVSAFVVLFRVRRAEAALTPADEQALRILVDRHGQNDSLSYFALRRDKSVVFSPDGFAAVAYRVEAGVCVAAGDPVGDPQSWPGAIQAWLAAIRPYGWIPAVIGASKDGARAYHASGMSVLELGDEAIVNTGKFSLRGAEAAPLRRAVGHAEKAGLSVRMRRWHDIPADELAHFGDLVDQWRVGDDERGFSMALGRWGDPADGGCLLTEAVLHAGTPQERTVGLLSFVPWGRAGVSLDVMRRSPDAPNGTVELMITDLCRRADEVGIRRVSLNFAMFRAVFEEGAEIGAGPILRLWRKVLIFLSRWWQMESLYRSNVKYSPEWVSRYLCFSEAGQLPRIGLAVAIAEGFVPGAKPRRAGRGVLAWVASNAPDLDIYVADQVEPSYREQERVRRTKVAGLIADGVDPWPIAQPPSHDASALADLPEGTQTSISGRVLGVRDFGGVVFVDIRDWTGRVQVVLERDRCGADQLTAFRKGVDLGDLLGITGTRGASRAGHDSLLATSWRMEAKCLHPMPDKWRGLTDPEALVRQRYLDLAVNEATRYRLAARSAVLTSLRSTLGSHGYLEVETPILQTIHGGANARPFRTHINAYDLDLYLRIAPELYLKRLCVGGMDRVFELGRTFRNEGVDFSHNPEFTILEAYAAHGDYLTMMDLTRELIQNAAIAANGNCVVPTPDGDWVDISGDWPVKTLHGAISEALVAAGVLPAAGPGITSDTSVDELRRLCDRSGVPYQQAWDAGTVALEMYEHLVEEHTTRPTFYTDFPLSVSPLTRSHRSTPGVTERWDLVAWGVELGTAYSELTDPLEQRRRLTAQSEAAAAGDPEAMELDEDFLVALEHGMPPTGGMGMGVDRLVMLITGASIRETLPFPMARPR